MEIKSNKNNNAEMKQRHYHYKSTTTAHNELPPAAPGVEDIVSKCTPLHRPDVPPRFVYAWDMQSRVLLLCCFVAYSKQQKLSLTQRQCVIACHDCCV